MPTARDWIRQDHVDLEGLWDVAAFRLYEAYDVVVGPLWRLELEVQPYAEIWLIKSGICAITIGDEHVDVGPGEVAVVRPGRRRVSANGGSEPLALAGFGCSVVLFDAIDLLGQLVLPTRIAEPTDRLAELITETVRASQSDATDRVFRARAHAELALAEIVRHTRAQLPDAIAQPGFEMRTEVRDALTFIASHHADHLDVAAIARAVHLSPKHLARCFRQSLGIAPMAYVRRYRLSRARQQLVTTDLPITRIALDTGFREVAHFSRAFRAQFGVSPRILRDHARALRSTPGPSEASNSG